MAVTQYIGARYVPIFADPAEWDNTKAYEPLTIVLYQGNSYTSAQAVPVGIDISNEEFWKLTGNYNAQIEAYRAEVERFDGRITTAQETADSAMSTVQAVDAALSTERNERIAADNQLRDDFASDINRLEQQDQTLSNEIAALKTEIETLAKLDGDITLETGVIANKAIYEILTFPKNLYRIDIKPLDTSAMTPGQALTSQMTISEYALKEKPFIAFNINPTGNIFYNGVLYGEDYETSSDSRTGFYGTTESGEFKAGRGGSFLEFATSNNCKCAAGAWQPLIRNGVLESINAYATFETPNPYPILAQDETNLYVMFIYARFASYVGMTVAEIQAYANNRGWQNVYLFDGGGSMQMATGNPYMKIAPTISEISYNDRPQKIACVITSKED